MYFLGPFGKNFLFSENFSFFFFKNDSTNFQKSNINGKQAHYYMCLHYSIFFLYINLLSTAFKNSFLQLFLKTTQSDIKGLIEVLGSLLA